MDSSSNSKTREIPWMMNVLDTKISGAVISTPSMVKIREKLLLEIVTFRPGTNVFRGELSGKKANSV